MCLVKHGLYMFDVKCQKVAIVHQVYCIQGQWIVDNVFKHALLVISWISSNNWNFICLVR